MLFPTNAPLLTGLALFGLSFANFAALGLVRDRFEKGDKQDRPRR